MKNKIQLFYINERKQKNRTNENLEGAKMFWGIEKFLKFYKESPVYMFKQSLLIDIMKQSTRNNIKTRNLNLN